MADVNTSSYPTIPAYKPPDPINALQMYGTTADVSNKLMQNKQIQLGLQTGQLELANQHAKVIQDNLTSLMGKPDLNTKDIISSLSGLIAQQRITPQEAAQELGTLPQGEGGSDPSSDQLRSHLQPYLLRSMDAQQRMNAIYGSPTTINTGGSTQVNTVSPINGVRSLASIPSTLPPTTQRFNPVTKQMEYVGGVDQPAPSPGSVANAATTMAAPVTASDLNAPVAKTGLPNPPPSGGIAAAPPLGAEAGANAAATKSGGAFSDTLAASQGYGTRMFQLTNALDHVEKLKETGPGTDAKNYMASFLLANTPGDLGKFLPGVDPKNIANYNQARKYTTQFAQARSQQFGGGTDAELAATLGSSPNITSLDKLSNVQLLKANIALENMNQAATLEAIKQNIPADGFQKFAATWGNSVDPRAFAIDLLPKAKQAYLVKGLSAEERPKFAAGLRAMKENNITIPNAQNLSGGE